LTAQQARPDSDVVSHRSIFGTSNHGHSPPPDVRHAIATMRYIAKNKLWNAIAAECRISPARSGMAQGAAASRPQRRARHRPSAPHDPSRSLRRNNPITNQRRGATMARAASENSPSDGHVLEAVQNIEESYRKLDTERAVYMNKCKSVRAEMKDHYSAPATSASAKSCSAKIIKERQ